MLPMTNFLEDYREKQFFWYWRDVTQPASKNMCRALEWKGDKGHTLIQNKQGKVSKYSGNNYITITKK